VLFLIPALSLVGIPPLSGFWAKLLVLQEAIAQGRGLDGRGPAGQRADPLLDDEDLDGGFLEAAPRCRLAHAGATRLWPAWLATIGLAVVTLAISCIRSGCLDYSLAAAQTLGAR
jgi:multicomponent Na+:H+ antiporter subunit D